VTLFYCVDTYVQHNNCIVRLGCLGARMTPHTWTAAQTLKRFILPAVRCVGERG
jgi:hypothetical protein